MSESLAARDARVCWHPYTQAATEPEPLAVAGASGAVLTLADGTELIDGISSWWATLHGHGEERIVRAASEQMSTLDHVLFAGATHEPAVTLAEELIEVAPPGLTRCFFSDNGSTAVEVALKMALQAHAQNGAPRRRVFVALDGGYHGDTFGAMSVGDPDPFFKPFDGLMFRVARVPASAQAIRGALSALGDEAAGVILEPRLQGAAGMRVHGADVLQAARQETASRGLPLIADEVMTGFGRTGRLFACDTAGIAPDILCLAKGLTGGMFPMSVTLATEQIFQAFWSEEKTRALFHGHTFTAHPVGCAMARESLRLVKERDVPGELTRIGQRIREGLAPLEDVPFATDLRVLGGMAAFDLVTGDAGYLSQVGARLRAVARDRGVLLRPLGNVVYALPPACTTNEQCDLIAGAMVDMARAYHSDAQLHR